MNNCLQNCSHVTHCTLCRVSSRDIPLFKFSNVLRCVRKSSSEGKASVIDNIERTGERSWAATPNKSFYTRPTESVLKDKVSG